MNGRILTDYYKMKMLKKTKSNRYDCVSSTGEYRKFESIAERARGYKRFFFYLNGVPKTFSIYAQMSASMAITNVKNISSIYMPDIRKSPYSGYGDVKGTPDALLFLFSQDYTEIEIFVARDRKFNSVQIHQLFTTGELNGEMDELRAAARGV